jgi:hypothetical protein
MSGALNMLFFRLHLRPIGTPSQVHLGTAGHCVLQLVLIKMTISQ